MTENKFTYRKLISFFRLGTDLLGKLPSKTDSALEVLVKLLAIADSTERIYGGKKTVYADVFTRYNLQERSSEAFVRLFWGSLMHTKFEICRHGIDEHLELIEAKAPNGGRLFFQEHRYGRPEISSEFFYTPAFDFSVATDALWGAYPNGIYLSVQQGRWTVETTFNAIPARAAMPLTSRALTRLNEMRQQHNTRKGEPWCFIATGVPGTGKSSFVESFAKQTNGRLLKIDAAALPKLGIQELSFILDVMRPGVLLIDDADRAPMDDVRSRVLFLFEYLRDKHPCTIAVTVNDPTKLDPALYRSERIDEVLDFESPDVDERREIFAHVLGVETSHSEAVHVTADFGHADVVGFAKRLRTQSLEQATKQVSRLRELANQAQNAGAAPKAP